MQIKANEFVFNSINDIAKRLTDEIYLMTHHAKSIVQNDLNLTETEIKEYFRKVDENYISCNQILNSFHQYIVSQIRNLVN